MDADYIEELVSQLRHVGTDGQDVEVKSGVGKDVAATLSAFANTAGGTLIIGLSESDGFTVIPEFSAKTARDKFRAQLENIEPKPQVSADVAQLDDSEILVVQVSELQPNQKPCFVTSQSRRGGSYHRIGDSNVKLSDYQIDRLLENQGQPTWDEEAVSGSSREDLDDELLNSFMEREKQRRPKTFQNGVETALQRLRVLENSETTLASLLSMGEFPQEYFPRLTVAFSVFPGIEKADPRGGVRLLDAETVQGPIPEMVERTVDLVRKHMSTAVFFDDARRVDLPDYPPVAVREAVTNALMHRDYSPQARGTQVQVNMYVDRLEVVNPGGLFGTTTLAELGQNTLSSARNQRLSTLLETVHFVDEAPVVENRGTGMSVIRHSLENALMPPPEFRDSLTQFSVTFHRRRVAQQEVYGRAIDRVLEELKSSPSRSTTELVETLAISRSSVMNSLNQLMDDGLVEQMAPPRSPRQRYRLTSKNRT